MNAIVCNGWPYYSRYLPKIEHYFFIHISFESFENKKKIAPPGLGACDTINISIIVMNPKCPQ